jgi:4-hydroxyphenylacetate decarboxylase small subunit
MKHYDCKYYLSIDVFKGLCKRDKSNINADDPACDSFENAKKCRNCSNFTSTQVDLGLCMNKYEAYPDMNALTCNDFRL